MSPTVNSAQLSFMNIPHMLDNSYPEDINQISTDGIVYHLSQLASYNFTKPPDNTLLFLLKIAGATISYSSFSTLIS